MQIQLSFVLLLVVVAFIVGLLIGYICHLGTSRLFGQIKAWGISVRNHLVDYWYVLVFVVTTVYVMMNFCDCIDLAFTEDFNGKNLIFLFWLLLIILPMFESFEGFGISIKKRKQEKKEDALTADYHNSLINAQKEGGQHE